MGIAKRTFLTLSLLFCGVTLCLLYAVGISNERIAPAPEVSRGIAPPLGIGKSLVEEDSLPRSALTFGFQDISDLQLWKEHVTAPERTLYEVQPLANGEKALRAYSRAGSSGLFQKVGIEMAKRPFLIWEWKVTRFPSNKKNAVLAAKGDNDFAARVIAIFRGKNPVPLGTMNPLFYRMIHYVWDDHFPEGVFRPSPTNSRVQILVVQNGEPEGAREEWVSEKRDLFEDYQMLFGKSPKGYLEAVGIFTDSDNTHTEAEAFYKSISVSFPGRSH